MTLRALRIPQDADGLMDASLAAFQYPENPEWSIGEDEQVALRDQIQSIKRYWPILRVGALFSSTLRHLVNGYVWEEDGKIAATLMYQKRAGKPPVYYINDVSVIPEYRRRGIARQMVERTLTDVRANGPCDVLLDVIAGNTPAYNLYKSLGWEHFSGNIHLILDADKTISMPQTDARYDWVTLPAREWKTQYSLARRVVPDSVRRYMPVLEADYRGSRFIDFLQTLTGQKVFNAVLKSRESGETAAVVNCRYRTRPGGTNAAHVMVDPAHISAIPYMLDEMVYRTQMLAPGRKLELMAASHLPEVAGCALAKGFVKRYEYHTMGLRLV